MEGGPQLPMNAPDQPPLLPHTPNRVFASPISAADFMTGTEPMTAVRASPYNPSRVALRRPPRRPKLRTPFHLVAEQYTLDPPSTRPRRAGAPKSDKIHRRYAKIVARTADKREEIGMTEQQIEHKGYAHPEALVTTEWVAEHLNDTENVRIVESDEDVLLYDIGHVPNAVKIDWVEDLNDPLMRDYLDPEHFASLMAEKGISPETTVVFYGDRNNWWATYALWVFRLFGHENVKVMDGGRIKWEAEGREMTQDVSSFSKAEYPVPQMDHSKIRAFKEDVMEHLEKRGPLVDVRSPGEYSGELLHMPDYPQEGALRGGHIPGAANVPWARAV